MKPTISSGPDRQRARLSTKVMGWYASVLLAIPLIPIRLVAEESIPGTGMWRFAMDNDSANLDSDGHYTHGMRLDILGRQHPASKDSRTVRWLPLFGMSLESQRSGFSLGTAMYTPIYYDVPRLIKNDRPFAGWMYGSLVLERFGEQFGRRTRDHFELNLGVVGPWAFQKELQTAWHEAIGDVTPRGWDNQLKNEPALLINAERAYKWSTPRENTRLGADLILTPGLALGNVMTYASAGATVRVGYNLPADFGFKDPANGCPDSRRKWGVHAFAGTEGRLVAHNIFLDGNTFTTSHHVAKNIAVADFKIGGVVSFAPCQLTLAYTLRTEEFKLQREKDYFYSCAFQVSF